MESEGLVKLPGLQLPVSITFSNPHALQPYRAVNCPSSLQPEKLQRALVAVGFQAKDCHRPVDPVLGMPRGDSMRLQLAWTGTPRGRPKILRLLGGAEIRHDPITHTLPSLAVLQQRQQQRNASGRAAAGAAATAVSSQGGRL